MKIEKSQVEKLRLTEIPGLDPVDVLLEDFGEGRGKLTISCFDESWMSSWGSMGMSLPRFIVFASTEYLVENLCRHRKYIADYDKDHKFILKTLKDLLEEGAIGRDEYDEAVSEFKYFDYDRNSFHTTFAYKLICEPWHLDWPEQRNPAYDYVWRIVEAVEKAVKEVYDENK